MQINFPATWLLESEHKVGYEIKYSPTLFDVADLSLVGGIRGSRRLVIVDPFIYAKYKGEIDRYLSANTDYHKVFQIELREDLKNLENISSILYEFEEFGVARRSEPVIAIGGGSLLDCVGFACSIYRRGIPYVRVPTTLLSIVDVSVAIKTGINHFNRRNRLGSYFPPKNVFINRKFIESQSQREISNGLGEIFKLAVIDDYQLFTLLEENANLLLQEKFQFGAVPVKVINRSISSMLSNLKSNLWEDNLERAVDFGHTFGPLIEQLNLPNLLHGEAVALDCLFSSCIAQYRGLIHESELIRIANLLLALGLPIAHQDFLNSEILMKALVDTTKHRDGNQFLPLPNGIGKCAFVNDVSLEELVEVIDIFKNLDELTKIPRFEF